MPRQFGDALFIFAAIIIVSNIIRWAAAVGWGCNQSLQGSHCKAALGTTV